MAILLGVDTGGTYTDAVLVEDQSRVIASAKSLTTKHDLSLGVGRAIAQVLEDSKVPPSDIGLASLSTTLATNALVEGQGGRVALVYVGFREVDLESHGLRDALAGDPALVLTGGHDHSGRETVALDETAFLAWLETLSGVSAFAVASQFATRNPDHERRIADLLQERTGRPVTCSHHLSSQLNGPKRALTAVLNARLVGMIARLIDLTGATLNDLGIKAPLMVVRGDGALISAVQAQEKPIETILSGPAASLVGARWLTGAETAIVSDIGGTTTDIALLRDGKPALDPAGARVGPWRTMVEAVAMRTTGLGGDSEVHVIDEGLTGGLYLGPRRVVPISLLATEAPDIVHDALDQQVRSETRGEHDARFVRAVQGLDTDGLASKDGALLERIGPDVQPLGSVLRSRLDGSALQRLLRRGLVQVSGVTPSDASHVLGWLQDWDVDAALKALTLMSRMSFGDGSRVSADAGVLAQNIVNQLTEQTSLAVLETVFAEEEAAFDPAPGLLARHILMRRALDGYCGLLRLEAGLEVPLIGLGASAPTYYPAVGKRLCAEMRLPEHAGVANAIGAVAGLVTFQRTGTVTSPSDGCFRVHFNTGPQDFRDENDALQSLETVLEHETRAEAERAGASDIKLSVSRDFRKATIESQDVFIEATVRVEASGRPRITHAGG
ncbi:MAG: hydantoinase/oxoprolinase family protein [Pseudomonadota bacterium]